MATRQTLLVLASLAWASLLVGAILVLQANAPSTSASVCPPVQSTWYYTILYGSITLDGVSAPAGTVVEAHSPRGDTVGCFVVTQAGSYGAMYVYGEDTTVVPPIPGMREGEPVTFYVNGRLATPTPQVFWHNDHDLHQVALSASSTAPPPTVTPAAEATPTPTPLPPGVCPEVENTLLFTIVYGQVTINAADAPAGTVIEARSPRGDTAGCTVADQPGVLRSTYVFGEDSTITPTLPGMRPGETIAFFVNTRLVTSTPTLTWTNDHDIHGVSVNLTLIPVQADFVGAPTSGIAPLTVAFSNTSTGDFTTSLWNFGDDITSTLNSSTHTYTTAGTYTVTLTAGGLGSTDTLSRTSYITAYAPVQAGFEAWPTSGHVPLTVILTNTSTGDFTTNLWDFGDGSMLLITNSLTSTLHNPTHTFAAVGVFTVTLQTSGPGGTDTLTHTNYITVSAAPFSYLYLPLVLHNYRANHPPNAPVSPLPADGATDLSVNVALNWVGGDLDGDAVTYDVYLEPEHSPPAVLICDDVSVASCAPGPLITGTHYYWQVLATDAYSATTVGPVWAFTTTTTIITGWLEVGAGSATGGGISDNDGDSKEAAVAIGSDGIPYVAWQDNGSGNAEIYVRRWSGSRWEEVGTGSASSGGISHNSGNSIYPSIAVAPDSSVYVAWEDNSSGNAEIYVRRWAGNAWQEAGTGSASGGGISSNGGYSQRPAMSIAPDGTPYVAWQDNSGGDDEVYVLRWTGSAWEEVGAGSASGDGISHNDGKSWYPALAIAPDSTPYVAWHDESSGDAEIYVRRWNGSTWEEVGTGSASGGGISDNSANSWAAAIAIAPDGTPYVVWHDHSSGDAEIYVRRWNGNAWEEVGVGSASGGGVSDNGSDSKEPSLAIAPDGTPYVAWYDLSAGDAEIYVRRWNGSAWEEVGANSASSGGVSDNDGQAKNPMLAIAPDVREPQSNDGTPYIVWHDNSSGDNEIYVRRWQ